MTQPAPVPGPPPAHLPPPPHISDQELQERILAEIRKEYETVTGEDIAKLPRTGAQKVHSLEWQVGHRIAGPLGETTPLTPGYHVHEMFFGEQGDITGSDFVAGDLRIYCVPHVVYDPDGEPNLFTRYTVNRGLPTANIRTEGMPVETFIEEIAREWIAFAILHGVLTEDETRTCATVGCEYETSDEDAVFCGGCGQRMPEDEKDEDEGEAAPGTAPAASGADSTTPTPAA